MKKKFYYLSVFWGYYYYYFLMVTAMKTHRKLAGLLKKLNFLW